MEALPDIFLQGKLRHFLTRPNEQILIAVRKHPVVLLIPLTFIILTGLFFIALTFYSIVVYLKDFLLLIPTVMAIIVLSITLATKSVVDWYFNIYIVTTGKLLEIKYTPLASFIINQVLLDQVRCTEIDIQKNGIISEFIDVGTIEFTFDRPTQREHFYFENVKDSRNLGILLSRELVAMNGYNQTNSQKIQNVWYKIPQTNKFNFVEEVFSA